MLKKKIVSSVAAFLFFTGSVFAAPAWDLPEKGLQFEPQAKHEYMKNKMSDFFAGKNKIAPFVAPDNWGYDKITIEGVKVERLEDTSKPNDRIVIQLHGGGYVGALSDYYRNLGVMQGVLTCARAVYMVDYRLAPKHKFPAALEDALKVYKFLLNHGTNAQNIYVYGDSAGGNLALALALKLKEEKLPQPKGYVLISPWASADTTLPSRILNNEKDVVLGTENKYMYGEVMNPSYSGDTYITHPLLSPIYGDFSGVSPMLIQVGGVETLYDDGMILVNKAAKDGVKVTLTSYPGMPHDFAMLLPELQDSVDSFREIKTFVESLN